AVRDFVSLNPGYAPCEATRHYLLQVLAGFEVSGWFRIWEWPDLVTTLTSTHQSIVSGLEPWRHLMDDDRDEERGIVRWLFDVGFGRRSATDDEERSAVHRLVGTERTMTMMTSD